MHREYQPARGAGEVALMLNWAFMFLIIALVAGALGLGGVAGAAAGIARVLFGIFIVLFLIGLVLGLRLTS